MNVFVFCWRSLCSECLDPHLEALPLQNLLRLNCNHKFVADESSDSLSVRWLGHQENDRVDDRTRPQEDIGDGVTLWVLEAFIYVVNSPGGNNGHQEKEKDKENTADKALSFFASQGRNPFDLDKYDDVADDHDEYRDENKDPIEEALRTSFKYVRQDGAALS